MPEAWSCRMDQKSSADADCWRSPYNCSCCRVFWPGAPTAASLGSGPYTFLYTAMQRLDVLAVPPFFVTNASTQVFPLQQVRASLSRLLHSQTLRVIVLPA